jgi:hypothetical protein
MLEAYQRLLKRLTLGDFYLALNTSGYGTCHAQILYQKEET